MNWFKNKRMKANIKKSLDKCGCACLCPDCKDVLNTNINTSCDDTDLVRYVCGECGCKSEWDFDMAPVPILIKTKKTAKAQG